jgi:hypothetical protein
MVVTRWIAVERFIERVERLQDPWEAGHDDQMVNPWASANQPERTTVPHARATRCQQRPKAAGIDGRYVLEIRDESAPADLSEPVNSSFQPLSIETVESSTDIEHHRVADCAFGNVHDQSPTLHNDVRGDLEQARFRDMVVLKRDTPPRSDFRRILCNTCSRNQLCRIADMDRALLSQTG